MTKFKSDIIIFDDHEFRGSAVKAMIETTQMVRTCDLHSGVLETDPEPGSTSVRIVSTDGRSGLGIYVAGGKSLVHPDVISGLSSIFTQFPDIAVVALRDECSSDDFASALHLGLQGIVPTYLPRRLLSQQSNASSQEVTTSRIPASIHGILPTCGATRL